MGIAHRIAERYAAKTNAVLDRVSGPRELADYSYVELQDLLTEVHRGAAQVAAGRERAQRRVSELQHAADRLSGQAERALTSDAAALSGERLTGQPDEISGRAEDEDELARIRERLASRAGHRTVPHTADLRIEAWAPAREECLAEAVRGLVGSFAVVAGRAPRAGARRHLTARLNEDLLVAVIDEVIYRLDADGQISVSVENACGQAGPSP